MTYYNEFDAHAAQWIANLSAGGQIAKGEVDSRSIVDVMPEDVPSGTQAHFFAGIGLWSLALRMAGVRDDAFIWTGSCPCQPFSSAGRGKGVNDARHLWPEWLGLIAVHRPPVVFGEQAASAAGRDWLSHVRLDMEALGYEVGCADLCAAGAGAPHTRQRLFFGGRLADANLPRLQGHHEPQSHDTLGREAPLRPRGQGDDAGRLGGAPWLVGRPAGPVVEEREFGVTFYRSAGDGACDWLLCRSVSGVPAWRPVRRGALPLVNGRTRDLGRFRAYGNAIVPQVASLFIQAFLEAQESP